MMMEAIHTCIHLYLSIYKYIHMYFEHHMNVWIVALTGRSGVHLCDGSRG